MAVNAFTTEAAALLAEIKKLIDENHIRTWSYDKDGDFTHTPDQFKNQAWFRPEIKEDRLRFRIIKPENKVLTREIYGIYHGRFIEMLVVHVPDSITAARALPHPAKDEPDVEEPTS